jgi:hypothetical protein
MLTRVWALPLVAAIIALGFALVLARQFLRRRRPHQAMWTVALLMYAAASFGLFLGVADGWTTGEYRTYWLFGAVLNVPYLAQGEVHLLVGKRIVPTVLFIVLIFATGFAMTRIGEAELDRAALGRDLPLGREVFRSDPFVLDLARYYALPAYLVLVGGTVWSALRMRGDPALRDRFLGTLGIAAGATVVATGSAFALTGNLTGFSLTLVAGIATMFWGFARASRPGRRPVEDRHPDGSTSPRGRLPTELR